MHLCVPESALALLPASYGYAAAPAAPTPVPPKAYKGPCILREKGKENKFFYDHREEAGHLGMPLCGGVRELCMDYELRRENIRRSLLDA